MTYLSKKFFIEEKIMDSNSILNLSQAEILKKEGIKHYKGLFEKPPEMYRWLKPA